MTNTESGQSENDILTKPESDPDHRTDCGGKAVETTLERRLGGERYSGPARDLAYADQAPDLIVPVNAKFRFRRTTVGASSSSVIWLLECRKCRKGKDEWHFVANARSPVKLGLRLASKDIYPDLENIESLRALAGE